MQTSRSSSRAVAAAGNEAARVVLVGAGHAHVQVLANWAADPPANARLTLVVDDAEATYSGMVPGVIAGDYGLADSSIGVVALARSAGAQLVLRRAVRIDPERRTIAVADGSAVAGGSAVADGSAVAGGSSVADGSALADGGSVADGSEIAYDLASLDVGSTVRGLEIPGVIEHALATRPIGKFVARVEAFLEGPIASGAAPRIAVVGAGAAGVEIAFTMHARLTAGGRHPDIIVVCGSAGLLPGYAPRARRLIAIEAGARGITVAATTDARFVDAKGVGFASGHLRADIVVWATGAASPAFITDSPLPHDPHGFVRVSAALQVRGHPGLFAVGDCAAIEGQAWVPKAGVHAVREGPVLDANLRAVLLDRPLRDYVPQRDFLSLLNLGGRRALATKWGLATAGRLPWILKDRIDRGFVRRFRAP